MDCIPTSGMFVVFTLDLVASVAHLENQELTTACKELEFSQKKFVAYVRIDTCNFPMPCFHYNPFDFHLVWQGHENLPFPIKARQVKSDMFFPILPNSYQPASCSDHRVIEPCQPLPWNDCYISSFVSIGVRCETEWTGTDSPQSPYQTTMEEEFRVAGQMASDNCIVYDEPIPEVPASPSGTSFVSDLSSTHEVKPIWTDEEPDMLSVRMADLLCGYYLPDERIIIQCSTDLSTVDTVNHPDELFKLLAKFYRLRDQLEASCKVRQIEEARRIDDAHYANYPAPESPADSEHQPKLSRKLLKRFRGTLGKLVKLSCLRRLDCRDKKT
ncbi:hypothetical protein VKT23_004764 [Stygiomarasmius scandens]|uniref:Uncharacterized protein n=1 Tax=Marasmiellus scandens TaxID=2682957 RepID=A0ABR1JV14_9AGAR